MNIHLHSCDIDSRFHPQPFDLIWIPAHKLEHIPEFLITEDMPRCHGTTPLNIANNRIADATGKREAETNAPIRPGFQNELLDHFRARQEWLIKFNKRLSQDNPHVQSGFQKQVVTPSSSVPFTIDIARNRFPNWPWNESNASFRHRRFRINVLFRGSANFPKVIGMFFVDSCRH